MEYFQLFYDVLIVIDLISKMIGFKMKLLSKRNSLNNQAKR